MSNLERPVLKEEFDNMPREVYVGLGYTTHRFADFIPVADGADQFALRSSIEAIGLVEPIMLFEGAILDGRHRYAACQKVGVEPRFVEFEGDEEAALQYVLARNVARRNLTTVQKLSLRDKLTPEIERLRKAAKERMLRGDPTQLVVEGKGEVNAQVGEMIGLSRETVRRADAVKALAEVSPEAQDFLADMMVGNIGVKTAYERAKAFDPAEIDRMAKKDASLTDANKMRAVLASAISKARVSLVDWDFYVLKPDWEVADDLADLKRWIEEAQAWLESQ